MKEKKFEAVLKRSVAMFNMMTGRDLTEREGNAFIQIFDLVDEFHQPGTDDATEAFNVITAVQPQKGLRDRPAADILQKLNIPTFVAAEDSPRQEVETPPVDIRRCWRSWPKPRAQSTASHCAAKWSCRLANPHRCAG